ncbi:hypothetical protein FACS189499_01190 [Clostridia bacterium]|nr:hypothetical protein FACS189499_01190 [Clostridia bacterium]
MPYDRNAAVRYAEKWALSRNPDFYDFENIGGDCTNFISQCLFAGSGVMNYRKWFYDSLSSRSPSWSSVELLHDFLIENTGAGPGGHETDISSMKPGDVIQLSFDGVHYEHSLMVVTAGSPPLSENIEICAHTYDSLNRKLLTYSYISARFISIF